MPFLQRQPQYMVNGRLIPQQRALDPRRFIIVLGVCLALWFSNPANNSTLLNTKNVWVTNYGFFSVLDYGDRIALAVANTELLDCPLNALTADFQHVSVCTQLRDFLAHEKPLLGDPRDYAYTLHRSLCAVLVLTALVATCYKPSSAVSNTHSKNTSGLLVNAVLSILLPNPQHALFRLVWSLWDANLYLYPVWQVLAKVAPLQHETSLFYVTENPAVKVAVSALAVFSLAIAVQAVSLQWTGRCWLHGLDSLSAVGLGYYRAIYNSHEAGSPLAPIWRNVFLGWLPDQSALTWMVALHVLMSSSFPGLVAFGIAHMFGFRLGDYQKEQVSMVRSMGRLFQDWQDEFARLFGF